MPLITIIIVLIVVGILGSVLRKCCSPKERGSRHYFDQGVSVSFDSSPTQNTPKIALQEPQYANAGPACPSGAGSLNSTRPTAFLQDGQAGFTELTVEFMGPKFLSCVFEFTQSTDQ
jgi:hypothetical protein